MNYQDLGFNAFLTRKKPPTIQLDDQASLTNEKAYVGGTHSGQQVSADGKVTLDWDKHRLIISDGLVNRVVIGDLDELGVYGIRILNADGSTYFEQAV